MNLKTILDQVPEQVRFPGPDEVERRLTDLFARHPDLVRRERIGTSREGSPIHLTTVGSGTRHALIFAGPHPNEPIGFLTVPYLAELLCADESLRAELGFTWHLIGCVDPDGARLNEGWYGGPFTRAHYARHMYRPPFAEQVEWTFPTGDDPAALPETEALRTVLDRFRPNMMCSLHNGEFGGTFYYLSHDVPSLAHALSNLDTGLPLHTGDAEIPGAERLAPGVFAMPTRKQINQAVGPLGASSLHYANRYGTVSMVVEVPLWQDERSTVEDGSGDRLADVLTETADVLAAISPEIGRHLDPLTVPDTPLARSLTDIRQTTTRMATSLRDHAAQVGDREATVAQRLNLHDSTHLHRLRAAGMALRVAGDTGGALESLFAEWVNTADKSVTPPLAHLLGAQLAAILTTAARV